MAWALKSEVKLRLRSAIPSGVTAFDADVDEGIDASSLLIQEWYRVKGLTPPAATASPPGIIADATADLAAAKFIEWNWERFGEALGEKAEILDKRAREAVKGYLEGSKEKRFYLGVNDLDSSIT